MYNVNLWKQSGHWQNYAENMFKVRISTSAFASRDEDGAQVTVEKEDFALKPMNCPGHCVLFNSRDRSYRELPLRLADFGVLHRNEASGALTGLTRVRRFQQDDAHIFCTVDQVRSSLALSVENVALMRCAQIEEEMAGAFDFLDHVYGYFGFEFKLELSTRPEKRLGDDETWDRAEQVRTSPLLDRFSDPALTLTQALENSLNRFRPGKWELNPGDGAFYGPSACNPVELVRLRH